MQSTVYALTILGTILASAIVVLLPLELVRARRRGQLDRRYALELLASASPLLPFLLAAGALTAVLQAVMAAAHHIAPWTLPITPWSAVLAVLAVDFVYYWEHRAGHRVRLLWALAHSVHHSSPQYNQTVGLRISLLDGFLTFWFYVPLVLVGFEPVLVVAAYSVMLGYQQWLHTETVGKLRWLDGWLNTPSNHRVHHGSQAAYLDKNYGGILMIWDRLFGTYQPEGEPVRYGLTQPIDSVNPIEVHLCEVRRSLRTLRALPTWKQRFMALLAPP